MTEKVKKKSKTAIANDHEKECEQMLIKDGWLTHKTQMARGWEQNKDIFNMFDILAFKGQKIRLVQVKTTNLHGSVQKIKGWASKNQGNIPDNVEMMVALKKYATKKKVVRWRIYIISKNQEEGVQHYDIGGDDNKRGVWECIVRGDKCKGCDGKNKDCPDYLPPQLPAMGQECE
jgi:hypothetical protein